jgi:hypothetical protein
MPVTAVVPRSGAPPRGLDALHVHRLGVKRLAASTLVAAGVVLLNL